MDLYGIFLYGAKMLPFGVQRIFADSIRIGAINLQNRAYKTDLDGYTGEGIAHTKEEIE